MKNYYLRRVFSSIITLLIISAIVFIMMHSIPGGPFTRERPVPPEILKALNAKYHLDDPLIKQYFDYMGGLVRFDLGPSFSKIGTTVSEMIVAGFPKSGIVGLLASILIVLIGVPVGVISALKQNKPIDYLVMFLATLGVTIPSFVMATLIIYLFAGTLGWLPTHGVASPLGYIGPVLAISGYSLSFVARLTRSSMLEVLRQDYIMTAKANGISERKVIFKHAMKNALIPVVTYVGPMVASIMTGSFVIEKIFAIPGMGRYFVDSVTNRDFTVIMGMTIIYAAFYIVMVLLVDILYGMIDPRISFGGKEN